MHGATHLRWRAIHVVGTGGLARAEQGEMLQEDRPRELANFVLDAAVTVGPHRQIIAPRAGQLFGDLREALLRLLTHGASIAFEGYAVEHHEVVPLKSKQRTDEGNRENYSAIYTDSHFVTCS